MHLHNFIQLQNISDFSLRENRHWEKKFSSLLCAIVCVWGDKGFGEILNPFHFIRSGFQSFIFYHTRSTSHTPTNALGSWVIQCSNFLVETLSCRNRSSWKKQVFRSQVSNFRRQRSHKFYGTISVCCDSSHL